MTYPLLKCLVVLVLFLAHGRAIPMSHAECPHGDLIRLKSGDSLRLECNSECLNAHTEFKWTKVTGEQATTKVPLQTSSKEEASLSIASVTYSDGGQYMCQCLPDGPQCLYNVTILPELSFTASDDFVHYGESFDLTCIVRGYPSNFSTIKTVYGIALPKQIRRQVNDTATRSYTALMEAEEGEFMCTAEIYFLGEKVDVLEKRVSVKVYEPPVIIYTTELVLHGDEDLGKPGELTCTVQTSPDVGSKVAWWMNGSQIDEGRSKYVMEVEGARDSDIRKHKLIINDVQLSDIGSYICQLSSDYVIEDVQEAWIQVDYRKRSEEQGQKSQLSEDDYITENVPGSRSTRTATTKSRSILLFIVCGVCVAACALGVWKFTKSKREQKDSPIIGYGHSQGNYNSFVQPGTYTNGTAVSRRKIDH